MPEWNLDDLYCGLDDPAIKRDLNRTDAECATFEDAYKGKLAALAAAPDGGAALAAAVRRYEAIDDLMGRLGSFAGLVHAANTVDPARTKFYGDVQERLAAASIHCCSSRSNSTGSRTLLSWKGRWLIPRSAITGPGSKTCGAIGPISSKIVSSSFSTKNR